MADGFSATNSIDASQMGHAEPVPIRPEHTVRSSGIREVNRDSFAANAKIWNVTVGVEVFTEEEVSVDEMIDGMFRVMSGSVGRGLPVLALEAVSVNGQPYEVPE